MGPIEPECVVLTLLHTLWQGAFAALVVYAALRHIPASRADFRYLTASAGLFAVVMAALVTWSVVAYQESLSAEEAARAGAEQAAVTAPAIESLPPVAGVSQPLPPPPSRASLYALRLWVAGAAAMLLRLAWLMLGARKLRLRSLPLEGAAR